MTDTRLAAMHAVVEAARADMGEWSVSTRQALQAALAALDALPTQPAGETVTLAVWEEGEEGYAALCKPNGPIDKARANFDGWRRLGTITLEVTP